MFIDFIFWLLLIIMLSLSLLIGSWKGANTSTEWMSAKNSMSFVYTSGSIIGTMVGAAFFIAIVIVGYENGILGLYIGLAYAFGLFSLGLFSGKIRQLLERNNSQTLFHFIEKSISKRVSTVFSIINLILFIFALAGQILALKYFFIDNIAISESKNALWFAILLIIIVTLIYVFRGGLRKDIISDIIQLIFMIIGLCFFVPFLINLPQSDLLTKLDPKLYTVGNWGPIFFIGVLIMIGPMLLVRADLWQRIMAAKSDKIAKQSFYTSAIVVCIFYCFFTYLGVLARGLEIDAKSNLIISILRNNSMDGKSITIMAISFAFICAVISTVDSLLNVASISLVRAIFGGLNNEEDTSLKKLKYASIFVLILSFFIIFLMPNIVNIFVSAISFVMVLSLPILLILFGFKPNEKATFWSIIIGAIVLSVLIWIIPKTAFVPSVITGWVCYLFITLWDKKNQTVVPIA